MLIPHSFGRVLFDRPALAAVLALMVAGLCFAGEYWVGTAHWQSAPLLLRMGALAVLDAGGLLLFACLTGYQVAISGITDRMMTRGTSETSFTALFVLEMLHLLATFFYCLVLVMLHPAVLDPVG